MSQPTKLVVLAPFDLDEEGNLVPAFDARQVGSGASGARGKYDCRQACWRGGLEP